MNKASKQKPLLKYQNSGFTLIEILIAISVITLLSAIGLVSYGTAQKSAQKAKVQDDFQSIQTNIEIARRGANTTLLGVTGHGCSDCICRGIDVRSSTCVDAMRTAWGKINGAPLQVDPWGNPYLIDENEYEWIYNPCRQDTIRSAGPDHLIAPPSSDDQTLNVSFHICQ